jgi:ankyrin repeat protein
MPPSFEAAIKENKSTTVHNRLIGSNGLPVDIRNKASQTGLMIACAEKNNSETVKVILDIHPDLEATDTRGFTALHYAVQCGSLENVKLLFEHNADINVPGTTLDINATTNKNETPLFLAAKLNYPDIVEYLTETKALFKKSETDSSGKDVAALDVAAFDVAALEVAIAKDFEEIAVCLITHLNRTNKSNEEELTFPKGTFF